MCCPSVINLVIFLLLWIFRVVKPTPRYFPGAFRFHNILYLKVAIVKLSTTKWSYFSSNFFITLDLYTLIHPFLYLFHRGQSFSWLVTVLSSFFACQKFVLANWALWYTQAPLLSPGHHYSPVFDILDKCVNEPLYSFGWWKIYITTK